MITELFQTCVDNCVKKIFTVILHRKGWLSNCWRARMGLRKSDHSSFYVMICNSGILKSVSIKFPTSTYCQVRSKIRFQRNGKISFNILVNSRREEFVKLRNRISIQISIDNYDLRIDKFRNYFSQSKCLPLHSNLSISVCYQTFQFQSRYSVFVFEN